MKVLIGDYPRHLTTESISKRLLFWLKNDENGEMHPFVDKFDDWLSYGSTMNDEHPEFTALQRAISKYNDWRERKVKVRIDRCDTWSMDSTLALIILPMLKQIQENKNGSPNVDNDDVPEHLQAPADRSIYETDEMYHDRWDYVLAEMIFAFERILDDDWGNEFHTGKIVFNHIKLEDGMTQMVRSDKDTSHFDKEGYMKVQNRINNGTRLFGKYYQGLWT